ncbi:hypothetical protein D3C81_1781560 [compost metagenome]
MGTDPKVRREIDQWHLGAASLVEELAIDAFDVFDPTWVSRELAKRMGGVNVRMYEALCSFQVLRLRDEVVSFHDGGAENINDS